MVDSERGIIKLIFPGRCIFCREILDVSSKVDICKDCFNRLPLYNGNPPVIHGDRFDELVSLCRYEGVMRGSIINYKFHNRESYFRTYASLLYEKLAARNLTDETDMVLAVPMHPSKRRRRGYNQSALLSSAIARRMKKPENSRILRKKKDTVSQSMLSGRERYGNVKGVFYCRKEDMVKDKKLLLVDDILTTGSTMNECSKVLRKAGAVRITAAVLATSREG